MSYTLATAADQVVARSAADTDCTILIVDGEAFALAEDGDDEVVGFGQPIREGQYVHNMYDGYSWYVQDGVLHSMHGTPDDMEELDINDGNQDCPAHDSVIGRLVAA